jgi:acyl-CoA synthetase (AMP-forming)/AMP-acid ligase II
MGNQSFTNLRNRSEITDATLPFLQYTSGSTAEPRGVMVSHGNLLHNSAMIQAACNHSDESTFVGWLPLYHDMGLIGNVIQPLYIGARSILISTSTFLQKPFCWLQAISHYKAATSGGPNFAYDLCVRKITDQQRAILDLSSWNIALMARSLFEAKLLKDLRQAFSLVVSAVNPSFPATAWLKQLYWWPGR